MIACRTALGITTCCMLLFVFSRCADPSWERMSEEKSLLRMQMQQSVSAINQEIQKLQRDRNVAKGPASADFQKKILKLEAVRSDLCDRITVMEDTTSDQWKTFRHEVIRSLDRARNVLRGLSPSIKMARV